MHGLLLWLWLAQGADTATTAAALHRGCVEQTYWSGNTAVIASGKLAATVTLTFGATKTRPAGLGKGLVIGFAGASTVATLLNARTLPHCTGRR